MKNLLLTLLGLCFFIPFVQSQSKVKLLPTLTQEEFNMETVPGDHTQHMLDFTYCESDPDRIYMAQDVGGIWVSIDAGKNWNTLSNYGLYSPFMISVEVDPLDKNRVLAVAQCRHYDSSNMDYQGIYLSEDGGINWKIKMPRGKLGEIRSSTKLITYAPSSKNSTLGYATRWYAAFSEYRGEQSGGTTGADDGLIYSDDGGETWTEVMKLDSATFGYQIRGIKVHPENKDTIFMYGTNGLYRFHDATNLNGSYERLSGKNGLPEGDIFGRLYMSHNGDTLIVPVRNDGIYKSTDGGTNWTELYDWNVLRYCFVNEGHPSYIYAVPSGEQMRFTSDGGKTWNTNVSVIPRPGYQSVDWWTKINGQFTCMIPDPRNPERVFTHTNSWHTQTDDSGFIWYPSDNGFNGSQHVGLNMQQMFDPENPDRFAYFMIDKGVYYTDTRGQWFYKNTIEKNNLAISQKSIKGGAVLPGSIILASSGSSTSGTLVRSTDNGQSWEIVADGNKRRWVVAYDPQSPNYCYQWRERSEDYGVTWAELPNMPENTMICGMAMSDGKVLYAIDNADTRTKIFRSTDRGDNWELVITSEWDLTWTGADKQFTFMVHPQNPNIVFTNSADGQISKWDLDQGTRTDFDVFNGSAPEENFFCNHFVIDPRYPDIMYVLNRRVNTGNKLFRTVDGGVTWENISNGFPNTDTGGLAVSPLTGEVFISGQDGSRVILPPYETSNTAFELVPYPNTHFDKPYGDKQMPYKSTGMSIPGRIEAEDYDTGGEGSAYHDNTIGNQGGSYRTDDVDIVASTDTVAGYHVGQVEDGEWLEFTIPQVTKGNYNILLRAASNNNVVAKSVKIKLNGEKLGTITPEYTGGWTTWQTFSLDRASVSGGYNQVLRLDFEGGNFNVNYIDFELDTSVLQTPYLGAERAIPGTIEAEDFDEGGEGVAYHDSDEGNNPGHYRTGDVDIRVRPAFTHINSITDGEWLEYSVSAAKEGLYNFTLLASTTTGFTTAGVTVKLSGQTLGTVELASTGNWDKLQEFTLFNIPVSAKKNQVLRLEFKGEKYYLDKFWFTEVSNPQHTFNNNVWTIPGLIEAEDYDVGGEGISYHDEDTGNTNNQYRSDDVDIKLRSDGRVHINSIQNGEWLEYTISEVQERLYDIDILVATPDAYDLLSAVTLTLDDELIGVFNLEYTGGWSQYKTLTLSGIPIPAGENRVLRIEFSGSGYYFDKIEFKYSATEQLPFGGIARAIPGIIEAEDYDIGGEGFAYHDDSPGNSGKVYRNDNVDIGTTTDLTGNYTLGWANDGEWLEYTIASVKDAAYDIIVRASSDNSAVTEKYLKVSLDNEEIGRIKIDYTAGWESWKNFSLNKVRIPGGENKILRFEIEGGTYNLNFVEFTEVPFGLHIEEIVLDSLKYGGDNENKKYQGVASVLVKDNMGKPVAGAEVSGIFSKDFSETFTGITDSLGWVSFVTTDFVKLKNKAEEDEEQNKKQSYLDFDFCVDSVRHESLFYEPLDNIYSCYSFRTDELGLKSAGINSNENSHIVFPAKLIVYPNPVNTGKFYVSFPKKDFDENDLRVVDLYGREVLKVPMSGSKVEISSTLLSPGVFLLLLEKEGQVLGKAKLLVR